MRAIPSNVHALIDAALDAVKRDNIAHEGDDGAVERDAALATLLAWVTTVRKTPSEIIPFVITNDLGSAKACWRIVKLARALGGLGLWRTLQGTRTRRPTIDDITHTLSTVTQDDLTIAFTWRQRHADVTDGLDARTAITSELLALGWRGHWTCEVDVADGVTATARLLLPSFSLRESVALAGNYMILSPTALGIDVDLPVDKDFLVVVPQEYAPMWIEAKSRTMQHEANRLVREAAAIIANAQHLANVAKRLNEKQKKEPLTTRSQS